MTCQVAECLGEIAQGLSAFRVGHLRKQAQMVREAKQLIIQGGWRWLANLLHILAAADEGAAADLGDRYLVAADVAVILLTDLFYSHNLKSPSRLL